MLLLCYGVLDAFDVDLKKMVSTREMKNEIMKKFTPYYEKMIGYLPKF